MASPLDEANGEPETPVDPKSKDIPGLKTLIAPASPILIVSNVRGDADLLGTCLADAHAGEFEIFWRGDLAAALQRLAEGGIQTIIAELDLVEAEGIDGLVVFERLASAAPRTPILVLSQTRGDPLAIQAMARGARAKLVRADLGNGLVLQTLRNMILRQEIEDTLSRQEARAEIALNSIGDAVLCVDMAGNVDYLNIAGERMTGWSRGEARGRPVGEIFRIINGETREPHPNPAELVLLSNVPRRLAAGTLLVRRDGSEIAIEDSASPILDWSGRLSGVVIVFHDMTAAQALTNKMAHLAQHDFLTNLPNRALLNDRVAQAIAHAARHKTRLAVLFIDLDNFKHINDWLGHGTGDLLLQQVARELIGCVRSDDTVSRQGGDEFVVLMAEMREESDAAFAAERILAALGKPHVIAGQSVHITTSIGIAVYPTDGADAEGLFKSADIAMYAAKEKGRNNFQFFRAAMNVRTIERGLVENDLRQALNDAALFLHYQPKINLATGAITGVEALARWSHPTWGIVPPARFIPVAEDCGLILPLGRWVLREACGQASRWISQGLDLGSIAVNVSAREFHHKDFVDHLGEILDETGLEPGRLQLEMTESVLMRQSTASTATLQRLRRMGVKLAIDDFGTGYSSLSYLTQFPMDVLKIDRSFVHDISEAPGSGVIAGAVIGMGNSLELKVVAEGVENEVQLAFLKERDCEEGQGYLLGRPVIAAEFARILSRGLAA